MSGKSVSKRDKRGVLKPAEMSEGDRDQPVAQQTLAAEASATTTANSCVESIVAALVDDVSLGRVRQNQKETLAALNDAAERISAMTKETADAYAENAAEFVRAARVAKEIQQDLDSASRRIAAVHRKLRLAREKEQRSSQEGAAPSLALPATQGGAPNSEGLASEHQ